MPKLTSTFVPKLWGSEEWIVNNFLYCGKKLTILPGFQCSLHYHPVKDETFYIQSGTVRLEVYEPGVEPQFLNLVAGESYRLNPNTPHRFSALGGLVAVVIEFSTRHDDADVVRLEDSCAI